MVASPPVVLELQDEPSMAAGPVPWGVGAPLAERLPGTVVVPITRSGPDPVGVALDHPGRSVVVSVRGVRRRAWQADVVAAVRAVRPEVVVVDHELPAEPDVLGEHYVLAFGAARVTAETVADLLAGMSAPRPDVVL